MTRRTAALILSLCLIIEPGKLADMIVLDQDILTVGPEHILDVNVEQTWLGGKLVYERR